MHQVNKVSNLKTKSSVKCVNLLPTCHAPTPLCPLPAAQLQLLKIKSPFIIYAQRRQQPKLSSCLPLCISFAQQQLCLPLPLPLPLSPLLSCCLLVWFKYLQRSERFSTFNFYEHFDDFDFTKSIFTHWPRPLIPSAPMFCVCTLGHSLLDVQLTKINRISDSDSGTDSIAGRGT